MNVKAVHRIRKFKRGDINKILEVEDQAFPKTAYPKETFLYYADLFPDSFIVLETGEDIAGYIIFDMEGHIHSTAVKPGYRRKGCGKMLFMYAISCTPKRVWLEVRSRNHGAIAFYERLGMKMIGDIPNYYGNDDALIMALRET